MPQLIIRPQALQHNLTVIREACARAGASCLFVFKEAPLHPKLVEAILAAQPVDKLGLIMWPDVELSSLPPLKLHHIYSPSPSLMEKVSACDTVYLSSRFSLERLASVCRGNKPAIRLSLECGDGRDGAFDTEIAELAERAVQAGFPLHGLSLNFACLSDKAPDSKALLHAEQLLSEIPFFDADADISAGGTDILELAEQMTLPSSVREIRCGTGVMLGVYPLSGHHIPDARQDTFSLKGCVLECRIKEGRRLALLDFGTYHTAPDHLTPSHAGMTFRGASSAYTVFDVTDCETVIHEGEEVTFALNYHALFRSLTSKALPFVYDKA